MVDSEGLFGGLKAAPPSSISQNLKEQGILDTVLNSLSKQFEADEKPDLGWLRERRTELNRSLYFTEPRPAAAVDIEGALQALYRAYVSPPGSPRAETKGVVLDRVVATLRKRGLEVSRGEYIGDFIFDAVVNGAHPALALKVLSFASPTKDWAPAERDAGHFLYGLSRLGDIRGQAVIQPPGESSATTAERSYARVTRWFEDEAVSVLTPAELASAALPI
jgi:hypothetical protein